MRSGSHTLLGSEGRSPSCVTARPTSAFHCRPCAGDGSRFTSPDGRFRIGRRRLSGAYGRLRGAGGESCTPQSGAPEGVRARAQSGSVRVWRAVRRIIVSSAGRTYARTERALERLLVDRRLHLPPEASRHIALVEVGFDAAGRRSYQASPWGVIGRVLREDEVSTDDVFLDLGCGIGQCSWSHTLAVASSDRGGHSTSVPQQ